MKKLFTYFVLLVFIFSNSHAATFVSGNIIVSGSGGGGGSTTCSLCGTCTGCPAANLVCEDWDEDNFCTWNDVVTDGTLNHAAAHDGIWPCTDKGSFALDILFGTSTSDVYTYYDMGASGVEGTDYFTHFSFKLISAGVMGAFNNAVVYATDSSTNPDFGSINLRVYRPTGSTQELTLYINGGTVAIDNNTSFTIGVEYELGIRWKFVGGAANDEVEFFFDGVSQGIHNTTDLTEIPRYVFLGSGSVGSTNYSTHFQIDNLEGATSLPADCPN